MKIIPFDPSISAYQEFSVNLGEFVCSFRFLWNERDGHWFVDFKSSLGSVLGVRIVEGSDLLWKNSGLGFDGNFRVLKTTKLAKELTYDSLGSDYSLVFGLDSEWEVFDGV